MVHHSAFAGRARPGDKLRQHPITAAFAEARDKACLTWPAGEPPDLPRNPLVGRPALCRAGHRCAGAAGAQIPRHDPTSSGRSSEWTVPPRWLVMPSMRGSFPP